MTFKKMGESMNRVREYRRAKKLSQMALAEEIGVARQTINLIENGKYNPSLDLCLKLAWVLDTDLNTLFWRDEDEES
ncbi:hypothetical protein CPBBRM18_IMEEAPEM_00010 [Companilactobacillus paralimentarius]